MLHHAALWSLLVLGGCALSSSDDPDPAPTQDPGLAPAASADTTRAKLALPRTLHVSSASGAEVTARRLWGDELSWTSALPIQGGAVTVRALADGRLTVDALTVVLGDVQLAALGVPPDGLSLIGIRVSVRPFVVAARWDGDERAVTATAPVELLLDWSLASQPGQVLPMATQHIGVPLTIELAATTQGRLVAKLRAARPGVFFTWTGLMELGDLTLTVEATE